MTINSFSGKYHFLSNFYYSPFVYNEFTYPTAEHTYQSSKAITTSDWQLIATASSPGLCKKLGRKIKIKPNWNDIKLLIMADIIINKFSQNFELSYMLIDTYPRLLIEGNTWNDTFWGQCPVGRGKNWLGEILMEYREQLIFSK